MNELLEQLPDEERKKLEQVKQPGWIDPMLATLTDERFSREAWIFERKLDGERCLAFREGDEVRLMSRNQKELNVQYPELVEAIARLDVGDFIVDGEVIAFEGDVTSFSRLQDRMHVQDPEKARASDVDVFYYLFDLPYFDGYDLTQVSLRRRKTILKQAFSFEGPLRFMAHRNQEGETFFEESCERGWEGIIAKDGTSPYVHSRSTKWLKFKCVKRQEFVIGGYTEPHGERIGFGALLLGYYEGDDLIYAGKVGTGFDDETLRRLYDRLSSIEQDEPPFEQDDLPTKEVHWVEPELVAAIGFEEWTDYGKLRQPRFEGLRRDKDPKDVVKEEPQ